MHAISVLKHNCIIKQFSQHLSDSGKHAMLILIPSMHKLLHNISYSANFCLAVLIQSVNSSFETTSIAIGIKP
ncbi:putative transposase [Orientia tsutsugamushi str. UT144]|uniref:Putative transposase n=1 Tax=Orientia tsutsugamushi str. UT144 TaxID=1441384 RepID=A0A0F3RKE9_ORITS|nr:putative transposase [Orientia tsutsugamushi str. UT144]